MGRGRGKENKETGRGNIEGNGKEKGKDHGTSNSRKARDRAGWQRANTPPARIAKGDNTTPQCLRLTHAVPPKPDTELLQNTATSHILIHKKKSSIYPLETNPFNSSYYTALHFVSASCLLCLKYHTLYPCRPHWAGKTSLTLSKQKAKRRETKGNELQ